MISRRSCLLYFDLCFVITVYSSNANFPITSEKNWKQNEMAIKAMRYLACLHSDMSLSGNIASI